jgi:hypothetical protein
MLVYFTSIWYILQPSDLHILWSSGTFYDHLVFFPGLVHCTKKNLAILVDGDLVMSFCSKAVASRSILQTEAIYVVAV